MSNPATCISIMDMAHIAFRVFVFLASHTIVHNAIYSGCNDNAVLQCVLPENFVREGISFTIQWIRGSTKRILATLSERSRAPFILQPEKYNMFANYSLEIKDVEAGDEGVYYCVAWNFDSDIVRSNTELEINEKSGDALRLCKKLRESLPTQSVPTSKSRPDEVTQVNQRPDQLERIQQRVKSTATSQHIKRTVTYASTSDVYQESVDTIGYSVIVGIGVFIGALMVIVFLIVVLVLCFCTFSRRTTVSSNIVFKDSRNESQNPESIPLSAIRTVTDPQANYGDRETLTDCWEFPRDNLQVYDDPIGKGAFGEVRKAKAVNINGNNEEMEVAVKTIRENAAPEEMADFRRELAVLKAVAGGHPNIVTLLGCCTEKDPMYIIIELVKHGNLLTYLRESRTACVYTNLHDRSKSLTPSDLLHFSWQIARGMSFLAENGCLHRDLAARNILIGDEKTCKISDFGLARDVSETAIYERRSQGRMPLRWMAPESLRYRIHTIQSDVWSYGVLLWEIVTLGSSPYVGMSARQVIHNVANGYRMEKPRHCDDEIYRIMSTCWNDNAMERPTFSHLCQRTSKIVSDKTKSYLLMSDFDSHLYINLPGDDNTLEELV